jgi:predicted metal-dependent hydrolase
MLLEVLLINCAINLDGQEIIPVVIQSPRRKTASVEIKQGQVTVRVPLGTPESWVQRFIEQRYTWITKHITAQLVRTNTHQIIPYESGEVRFRGRDFPLIMCKSAEKNNVGFDQELFKVNINNRTRKAAADVTHLLLQRWLAQKAEEYLVPRTLALAKEIDLYPTKVSVGNFKSMWGRCSAKGEIALNWRLIMADEAAMDYVIIHELCHLHEFNHSPAFWDRVALHCSGYSQWRQYFKERSIWLSWR